MAHRGAALRVVEPDHDPHYAGIDAVEEFAANLPEKFLYCREMGHNWKPFTAGRFRDGGFSRILRCARCRTERHQELSSRGMVTTNKYVYPDNYNSKGIGRIVGEGRGVLRLESINRLVAKGE